MPVCDVASFYDRGGEVRQLLTQMATRANKSQSAVLREAVRAYAQREVMEVKAA